MEDSLVFAKDSCSQSKINKGIGSNSNGIWTLPLLRKRSLKGRRMIRLPSPQMNNDRTWICTTLRATAHEISLFGFEGFEESFEEMLCFC